MPAETANGVITGAPYLSPAPFDALDVHGNAPPPVARDGALRLSLSGNSLSASAALSRLARSAWVLAIWIAETVGKPMDAECVKPVT